MLSCDWRETPRMAQKLLKTSSLFRVIVAVSLVSTAALIGFGFLSELNLPLLPSSYNKRSPKKPQDYPTMATKSVFAPVISRYTGFNSSRHSNLSIGSNSIQPSSVVMDGPVDEPKSSEVEKKRPRSQTELRRRSLEHCSALEHSKHIKEVIPDLYKLSAVAVVFRHGERTPLYRFFNYTPPEKTSCNFSEFIHSQSSDVDPSVQTLGIDAEKSRTNLKWQNAYPNSRDCSPGQLTSQGFLQMIRLGMHFRNIYFNGQDLSKSVFNASPQISVRTTGYGRTIQSAFGFVLGLLQDRDFEKVKLSLDEDIYMCSHTAMKSLCNCPAIGRLSRTVEQEHSHISAAVLAQERHIKAKLAAVFNVSAGRIPWIGAMLETFMLRACLGLNPPCRTDSPDKNHCVSWSLMNKMWEFSDRYGEQNLNSSAEEKFSLLTSYPLLHDIVQSLLNVTNYSTQKNSTRLFVFSGHDKTLVAIMKALRIYAGHWPPFASQVTFELYNRRNKQFYIRILYNGDDVTERVRFCSKLANSSRGFCPFENFVYFILYEVYMQFKAKDYSEMCK